MSYFALFSFCFVFMDSVVFILFFQNGTSTQTICSKLTWIYEFSKCVWYNKMLKLVMCSDLFQQRGRFRKRAPLAMRFIEGDSPKNRSSVLIIHWTMSRKHKKHTFFINKATCIEWHCILGNAYKYASVEAVCKFTSRNRYHRPEVPNTWIAIDR